VRCAKCKSPYWDIPRDLEKMAKAALAQAPAGVDAVEFYAGTMKSGSVNSGRGGQMVGASPTEVKGPPPAQAGSRSAERFPSRVSGLNDRASVPSLSPAAPKIDMQALRDICAGNIPREETVTEVKPIGRPCTHVEPDERGDLYRCGLAKGHKGNHQKGERVE